MKQKFSFQPVKFINTRCFVFIKRHTWSMVSNPKIFSFSAYSHCLKHSSCPNILFYLKPVIVILFALSVALWLFAPIAESRLTHSCCLNFPCCRSCCVVDNTVASRPCGGRSGHCPSHFFAKQTVSKRQYNLKDGPTTFVSLGLPLSNSLDTFNIELVSLKGI